MSAPFQHLSLEEFADLLARFPFKRQINAVHMHHTWRPNHSQDQGLKSIEGMWQYHTQVNGWSDIAQHITIAKNGDIWTGRSWNQPPASAAGHNGNREIGPFMFEMIGDFDAGHDRFEERQLQVALEVIARVQLRFNLPVESLKFHNQMSRKSCPGTSINYDEVLQEVRQVRLRVQDASPARNLVDMPFPPGALAFRQRTDKIIQLMSQELPEQDDPGDAEPDLRSASESDLTILTGIENPTQPPLQTINQRRSIRDLELSASVLSQLRPHVINLAQGEFSSSGIFATSPGDVDAIFQEHLPRELAAAKADNRKLRLVFYAHGGLTSEKSALHAAYAHLSWWRENHIYPIYFIWETGLLETIGQLLGLAGQQFLRMPARRGIERDIWDATSDPVLEELVRNLGCVQIWAGMKRSAERSFQSDGGGLYLVQKLKEFCDRHVADRDNIELHGIGHSAGAIFQSHFVPAAHQEKVPSFKTMHFLAPAIRVDTFKKLLFPDSMSQGQGIDRLTIFTMKQDWELADNCVAYRKSLLYLIYYALEPERKTPILGLEESLRADPDTRSLFGLSGQASATGEVIWSKSVLTTGPNASTCTSHGLFPADPPTMNSVLLRIIDATDNQAIVEFPEAARDFELLDFEELTGRLDALTINTNGTMPAAGFNAPVPPATTPAISTVPTVKTPQNGQVGRRLALCVGIDAYPTPYELYGCVADANLWVNVFSQLGFTTTQLLNQQATRSAILDNLGNLVRSSQPGDVIAFQFSGHGTQLPDLSRDEAEGDSPGQDEAICPYDFANGTFVIDDDIGEIFNTIPAGVNVTCFIDCCHSGTISRFAVGTPPQAQTAFKGQRARFIQPTNQIIEAHRRFRERTGTRAIGSGGFDLMKEVVFSACLSIEVAYENNGQGDFTRYATQLIQQGIQGLSHEEFERRAIAAFGSTPRQHPRLYCNATIRGGLLLQSFTPIPSSRHIVSLDNTAALVQGFRMIADLLERK